MTSFYDIPITLGDGTESTLADYRGRVLLIVNTASKCGFTPQFNGLEKLHRQYEHQGLTVIGFPCNQFRHQDPGSQVEIARFAKINYAISFPLMAKIEVNGDQTAPLYQHLKKAAPGILGSTSIKWNFTKFLVSADGTAITRYGTTTKPHTLFADIERLLENVEPAK